MSTVEFATSVASTRISELLVAELIAAANHEEFGVIAQDVAPVDLAVLLSLIEDAAAVRGHRLRVCLVGYTDAVQETIRSRPHLADVISSDEETAVAWRNRQLRTVAVVTDRPLEKAASLREFRIIDERTLAHRLCADQRDRAEATWLRALWDALDRGTGVRSRLADIVRFAEVLDSLPPSERSASAPAHLPVLGLFADSHLADAGAGSDQRLLRRLQQNRDLVSQVRRATDDDWSRVRLYCRSLSGTAKTAANRLLRRLREMGNAGTLVDDDYSDVQTLWRAKPANGQLRIRESDSAERIEVERVVGKMLMTGDDARLSDVSHEIRQIIQAALDDDVRNSRQDVRQASSSGVLSILNVDRDLLELVKTRTTADDWGGIIDISTDKPAALTEISAFKDWRPFTITSILGEMAKFIGGGFAPQSMVAAAEELVRLRAILLPHVCEIAVSPVSTLAGDKHLLAAAEGYLDGYEQLLRQLNAAYQEMHAAADIEAESIIGQVLSLELYVYRRDGHLEAVMSPLHPLHLWRSVTIVRELRGLAPTLSEHELHTLESACAEDLQVLQVLILPPQATLSDQPLLLGQAGAIGRLPIFREAPRGMLEADGVRTIAELAQRLAQMRPFVRPGLQVMLVNLPHPVRFIEELLGRLQLEDTSAEDTFWGIHIRVRYTDEDTRGWSSEINDISDELRQQLSSGEERGLLSVSIQSDIIGWKAVLSELKERPSHLTVVIDPFQVRSTPVARAQAHGLSPWMPTCEYRFNQIRREIQVIPVAEEHLFGSYLASASLVHPALQRKTPAHIPQVAKIKEVLDELADYSSWIVIADPHRVPLARLGDAEVIDRRIERGRQLTCFAHDLSPFVRRLKAQLRRTHFLSDKNTLERLVRDLVAMEPNGILSLASTSHEKQVKGSLGKLIAARWYRIQQPSGLAVSLDTDNARRWLVAGTHSQEKADLLGLREEDGGIVVDVIEVKAHDEALPYTVDDDHISGKPVEQVLATLQALAEVFSPDSRSPLSKPRREVLREHLYTALLRDQQTEYVERWHSILEDVFAGNMPVRLAGRIIHVQLASVANKSSRLFRSRGVPIRVDTLSAQDVGFVLKSAKPSALRFDLAESTHPEMAMDTIEPSSALHELMIRRPVDSIAQIPDERGSGLSQFPTASDPSIAVFDNEGAGAVVSLDVIDDSTLLERQPVSDPSVILTVKLGTEYASSSAVEWHPGRQSNGFFLILGASGSGKTETLKVLGSSIHDAGIPVLIFDFHGDVTFPGVRSLLLSSGSASTVGLNPMDLDIHSAEESGLYDQRSSLRGMIMRAVPALGHRQSTILREAFDEAYLSAGIRDMDQMTWTRPAPTFRTVQLILEAWAVDDARKSQKAAIEGCLAAIQELFDHPIFQRDDHVSIEEILRSALRLDLSKLPEHVRFIATETLLRKIFRTLRLRGPIPVAPKGDQERFRLFILIDEAKILSLGGADRDRSDNILNELITEARKFGLGMILASQMGDHFSEEVRANAATWLVLKPMDIREAKRNAPNVSVDPDDLIHLRGKGDGYYRDRPSARARRIQVRQIDLDSSR